MSWFACAPSSDEIKSEVGVGTFGRVLECERISSGASDGADGGGTSEGGAGKVSRRVAIKVVRSIKRYSESAEIEARILADVDKRGRARGVDLCVAFFGAFQFEGHCCLVFESLGRSLYDYLKMNDYRPFPFALVQQWTSQMLEVRARGYGAEDCPREYPSTLVEVTLDLTLHVCWSGAEPLAQDGSGAYGPQA